MKYNQALIPGIKTKIEDFLKIRKYSGYLPVEKAFADHTRRTYYSGVTDRSGKKYFIKIRTLDLLFDKISFQKQVAIGELLCNHSKLELNQYTPKMIEGRLGEIDYLLYEYVEGTNMGSRDGYGTIKFTDQELGEILKILKALIEIPVASLQRDFEKRGSLYYQRFVNYGVVDEKLNQSLNIDWDLFDQSRYYFTHGDFKPNNFLRTKHGLKIIDLEQSSISNLYTDVIRLWTYAFRKPAWREQLLASFLKTVGDKKNNQKLLRESMLVHAVFELNYLKSQFPHLIDEYAALRMRDIEIAGKNRY